MAPSEAQTNVRIPVDLKTWLQEQARTARRTLTQEVVLRLERTRDLDLQQTKGAQQ